ncbi:MAG TPA: hypothetical protein PLB55_01105 [Prosthecobacter sp.]|nr:hypothetical protein [Prosthecobacter sp.]
MNNVNPKFAPPAILEAALHTLHHACVMARNCTLPSHENITKANSLMEAVHEVPNMLIDWHEGRLREIRTHFGCFDFQEWPGSPDLVVAFNERLTANTGDSALSSF